MADVSKFKPKTVYVTYIDAPLEKVWRALIDPQFTRQYFFGFAIEIEPRSGGAFRLLAPDGGTHVSGEVVEWSPPHRLCVTWRVAGMKDFGELPECLVSYDIAQAGGSVQVTMTESHSWDVPDAILRGGQSGWPKILSSLKSVLETGKALSIETGMPAGFVDAVKKAVVEKPWLRSSS
ncbi:MAG: ATPase [Alphaproteobacteria bacterium]|nr:MAG: ATPase [Alphaproteobacteria bacterium]